MHKVLVISLQETCPGTESRMYDTDMTIAAFHGHNVLTQPAILFQINTHDYVASAPAYTLCPNNP